MGAITETHSGSTITKRIGRGNNGTASDRFPPIEDVLRDDRLFDRLAAVA
ncbi:MAG: hypothetical protein WBB85_06535 [Albidovulum sp.]